jgi:uncharacterized protein (UPF0261 family)
MLNDVQLVFRIIGLFEYRTRSLNSTLWFQITLMRTTPQENREAAKFIADKLNHSVSPLRVLLPEKGVSALDAEGQAFYNPEATGALFEELEKSLQQTPERKVSHFHLHKLW